MSSVPPALYQHKLVTDCHAASLTITPTRSGFAVPRWIAQKRAAGMMDEQIAATWELITQKVFRPNAGAFECAGASSSNCTAELGTIFDACNLYLLICHVYDSSADSSSTHADIHRGAHNLGHL